MNYLLENRVHEVVTIPSLCPPVKRGAFTCPSIPSKGLTIAPSRSRGPRRASPRPGEPGPQSHRLCARLPGSRRRGWGGTRRQAEARRGQGGAGIVSLRYSRRSGRPGGNPRLSRGLGARPETRGVGSAARGRRARSQHRPARARPLESEGRWHWAREAHPRSHDHASSGRRGSQRRGRRAGGKPSAGAERGRERRPARAERVRPARDGGCGHPE